MTLLERICEVLRWRKQFPTSTHRRTTPQVFLPALRQLLMNAAIALVCLPFTAFGSTTHKGLTLQAFIKKPDGSTLSQSNTNVKVQILSPTSNCVLMEESHAGVNFTDGLMSLVVGTGTRVPLGSSGSDKGLTLAEILDNKTTRSTLDPSTTVGSANCTYAPTSQDPRIVRVSFPVGSETIEANFTLRSVAFAVEAERLEGKASSEFVQVNDSKKVTQQNLEDFFNALTTNATGTTGVAWNGSSFTTYDPSSGSTLASNSVIDAAIASLSWSKLTSVPAPLAQIGALSCTSGQILKHSGTAWACAAETGGSLTLSNGTSGTAPAFSGSGSSYTLNIPMASAPGVTAGLLSKTDYDSFAAKLEASSTIGVANGGTGSTSLAAGNILIGNGTSAVSSLAAGSIGNVPFATGAATWASGSPDTAGLVDKSSTQTISGAKFFGADLSLVLQHSLLFKDADSSNYIALRAPATVAADRTFTLPDTYGTNGQVLTTDGTGTLSWNTVSGGSSQWTTSGSDISYATGKVGVGTTAPESSLHVSGSTGGTLTLSAPGDVNASDSLGKIDFYTYDASLTPGVGASIGVFAQDNGAAFNLQFNTRDNSNNRHYMTLGADGVLYVGNWGQAGRAVVSSYPLATSAAALGTNIGGLHLPPGWGQDNMIDGITFGAYDTPSVRTNAQAGLYVQSSPSYGTKMYLATTDNFTTGAQVRMTIDHSGNVGIGTTSPAAKLDVAGHLGSSGPAPSVSSCGSSPVFSGTDTRGTVTVGGGSVTSCTITFASAYATAPFCVVSWTGIPVPTISLSVVSTQTDLTVHFSADANSRAFNYICLQ